MEASTAAGVMGAVALVSGVGLNAERKNSPEYGLRETIDKLQREIDILKEQKETLKKAKEICESKSALPSVVPKEPEPVAPKESETRPVEPVVPKEPEPVVPKEPEPVALTPLPVLEPGTLSKITTLPEERTSFPSLKARLEEARVKAKSSFMDRLKEAKKEVSEEVKPFANIPSLAATVPKSSDRRPPVPPPSTRRKGGYLRKKKLRTRRGGKQKKNV